LEGFPALLSLSAFFAETRAVSLWKRLIQRIYIEHGTRAWICPTSV
jgi:hypothetical protein